MNNLDRGAAERWEDLVVCGEECPELGWRDFAVLRLNVPEVLAIRYDVRGVSMLTLHNVSSQPQTVTVDPKSDNSGLPIRVFDGTTAARRTGRTS